MPPRAIIETLSPDLRDELNQRMVASGYGDNEGHAEWLKSQGVQIEKSAVGEYNLRLRKKMEARQDRAMARVEIHKAYGGLKDGDKAALLESGELAAYDAYLDAWDEFAELPREERIKALPGMIRAGADLSRSAVGTAKWTQENRERERRQALEEAAKRVEAAATAKGMDAQEAGFWVEQVLKVF